MPSTAPPLTDDLAIRAAERRMFLAQQKHEAASFKEVLSIGCPAHEATPGKPCWRLGDSSRGVCGPRISRAIGVAGLRRARQAREKEMTSEERHIIAEGRRQRRRAGIS